MQEIPARLKGDAASQIDTPADGRWNEAVREAYADRVQARLERVMRAGRAAGIVGRRAYSPADLETLNCNLVGGDPYSGICSPDQFFWLRPFAQRRRRSHHPPVARACITSARPPTPVPDWARAQARWSPGEIARKIAARRPGPCHIPARGSVRARDGTARAVRPSRATRAHASQLPYQQQHTPWLGDKAMRKSMPAWALLLASALGPSRRWPSRAAPCRSIPTAWKTTWSAPCPARRALPDLRRRAALRHAARQRRRWCARLQSRSTCWRHASSGWPRRCWAAAWRCTP